MQLSGIPTRFPIPWGSGAVAPTYIRSGTIPVASQIGINPGFASLTDGFPPLCFSPIGIGGSPPFGQDANAIFKQVTQHLQWLSSGGPWVWDSSYSTSIGGYPQGAVVPAAAGSSSDHWVSLVDNNAGNPDAGADNWNTFGRFVTGDLKFRPTGETLSGWVKCNATTIGSPSSGAGQLANNTCLALYLYLWANFSNTQCPVTGGRGGSAAADFSANKSIQVLDLRGYGIVGMDTMGGGASTRLTGVPVTLGNATTAGSLLGENLHVLTSPGELPAHSHGVTDPTHTHGYSIFSPASNTNAGPNAPGGNDSGATTGASATGLTVNSTGSSGGHNTVALSINGTWFMKL
jgi:hypothetical protein